MSVPRWYDLLLLALASWRTWRLLAQDKILDSIRARAFGLRGWEDHQPVPASYRRTLAEFVTCPACLGAWTSTVWYAAWQWQPHAALAAAALAAISAIVMLVEQHAAD